MADTDARIPIFRRFRCRLRGEHNWIAAQSHWWEWGGSQSWTPTPSHDPRFNGVGCRDCGRFEYVQQAASRPAEAERDRYAAQLAALKEEPT